MRKNSIKNTRVNAEVQRELSNILRGGINPQRTCTYSEYAQHTTDYIYRRPVH